MHSEPDTKAIAAGSAHHCDCPMPAARSRRTPPALVERLPARAVARILGVKTATLSKWRQRGYGPQAWIAISQTLVVYDADEVRAFLEERTQVSLRKEEG